MDNSIYKLFMFKFREGWYGLPEEDRKKHIDRVKEALDKAGGKSIMMCASAWSSEQWHMFGLEEFPDLESVRKHSLLLAELKHWQYIDSTSLLGTKYELG